MTRLSVPYADVIDAKASAGLEDVTDEHIGVTLSHEREEGRVGDLDRDHVHPGTGTPAQRRAAIQHARRIRRASAQRTRTHDCAVARRSKRRVRAEHHGEVGLAAKGHTPGVESTFCNLPETAESSESGTFFEGTPVNREPPTKPANNSKWRSNNGIVINQRQRQPPHHVQGP